MRTCKYSGCPRGGEGFLPAYPTQDYCTAACRRDDKKASPKPRRETVTEATTRAAGKAQFKSGDAICRGPNCTRRVQHEHHAVYEKTLVRLRLPIWDRRNALGLCVNCHFNHHHGIRKLPLTCLHQRNIDYAFEVMKERAGDYLRRKYDGFDARVQVKETEIGLPPLRLCPPL
jgi:hypothetical protein